MQFIFDLIRSTVSDPSTVLVALCFTVSVSCIFFCGLQWLPSLFPRLTPQSESSSRQTRKVTGHSHVNPGNNNSGGVTSKIKKSSAVNQKKKNSNSVVRASTIAFAKSAVNNTAKSPNNSLANAISSNGKNTNKKKKAINKGTGLSDIVTHLNNTLSTKKKNNKVSETAKDFPSSGDIDEISNGDWEYDRRTRRRNQKISRSGGGSSTNSVNNSISINLTDNTHRNRSSSWSLHNHINENYLKHSVTPTTTSRNQDQSKLIMKTNKDSANVSIINNKSNQRKQPQQHRGDNPVVRQPERLKDNTVTKQFEHQVVSIASKMPKCCNDNIEKKEVDNYNGPCPEKNKNHPVQIQGLDKQKQISESPVVTEKIVKPTIIPLIETPFKQQPSVQQLKISPDNNTTLPKHKSSVKALKPIQVDIVDQLATECNGQMLKMLPDDFNKKITELQAEHDFSVKTLQAEHDLSVKTLQADNEEQYATLQIKHKKEFTELKIKHEKDLIDSKTKLTTELTSLQEKHDVALSALKTENKKDLTKLQIEHDAALMEMKADYDGQLKNLQTEHQKEMKALQTQINILSQKLEEHQSKHNLISDELRASERKVRVLKRKEAENELKMNTVLMNSEQQILELNSINTNLNMQLEQLQYAVQNQPNNNIQEYETTIQNLRQEIINIKKKNQILVTEKINSNHETSIKSLQIKHEDAMKGLRAEHTATIRRLQTEHMAAIEAINVDHEDQLQKTVQNLNVKHEAALLTILEEHKNTVKKMQKDHETIIKKMQKKNESSYTKHESPIEGSPMQANRVSTIDVSQNEVQQEQDIQHQQTNINKTRVLETENKRLLNLVAHYKKIIFDTEEMLSELRVTVDREESKWSQDTATLQQQLDEARLQLDDLKQSNKIEMNKQKSHNNSEDLEKDNNETK